MRRVLGALWGSTTLVLAACASGGGFAGSAIPDSPLSSGRCRVGQSSASPIVTEWSGSEKANLEVQLRAGGGVAVEFTGCEMRVIPDCRLRGDYVWQRTSASTDTLEIENQDDLYAKLPLGAATLSGELARSGRLAVQTTVSGQLRLRDLAAGEVPNEGACARATHVLGALSVGAFSLYRAGSAKASGTAGVAGYETGGSRNQSLSLMRASGDPAACSSSNEESPAFDCRSPIQAFLWGIPGRAAEEGPPGSVKVDLLSANASSRWDVYVDDVVICTTPCSKWLDPSRPILFRTRDEGMFAAPDRVRVGNLQRHTGEGPLAVQVHTTSHGELASGIVFTSFGGMAVLTGVALTGLGCATDRDGMCTGGIITLGVGAVLTAGSIWLILDSSPHARIEPLYRSRVGRAEVKVYPGLLSGSF